MKIGEDDDMHFNPFVSRGRWMDNWLGFAFKSLNMWGVLFGGLIIKRQCCSWIIEGISGLGIFGLLGGKAHKKNTKKKKTLWKLGGFDCWITRVWREREKMEVRSLLRCGWVPFLLNVGVFCLSLVS